ncbi:MAG: TIGR03960 family B12-binding radical SAM protein [Calditrichia bacterium]
MDLSSRIEKEFLPFVLKPGRYTGNEYNVVMKEPSRVAVRAALAFPEVYELGMSFVGYDILYHVLNREEDIWAERVYAPWTDAEAILKEKKIPLFSLESRTPLVEFDWIGFTLQYELTYTNILTMLELAGIPFRAKDRDEQFPLIIGGGSTVGNPEPIAEFFDAILIGDGEEAVLEICEVVRKAKAENLRRQEVLELLAGISGMYVPGFYEVERDIYGDFKGIKPLNSSAPPRIKKRIIPELSAKNYPLKPLVPLIEITHDRLAVEIMRGCSEGCRYCNAGMVYRPVRQRPAEEVLRQTVQATRNAGFEEVSLLSLNSSDYQELNWLMLKEKMLLNPDRVKFSFPSLRVDAVSSEMMDFAQSFKKSGFTFAPEAGSQRLRNVINKNIREEDILDALKLLLDHGWQLVKFYFMIGLPTEKDEDILAIVELIEKCRKLAKGYKNVRFNISISPFSPKPHTPFQWEKQDLPGEVDRKIQILQQKLTAPNVSLTWRDGWVTSLESIFARGGRELAAVIETAHQAGARFDGWNETFNWAVWEKALNVNEIDWKTYLRPLSVSLPLPWDHIDMGVSKSFLQQEKVRSYESRVSHDCMDYTCLGCGLQRKEFENLVRCYKKESRQGSSQPTRSEFTFENTTTPQRAMAFGRGTKRRIVPTPIAKKTIRVQYSKTGLSRFLSHLDVVRVFDRAARRAKISLVYSQGFNPRPKMAFGPPLSLGIASIAEYVDLEAEIGREADFQIRLNEVLPQGIRILSQKTIFSKAPSLSSVINLAVYETFLEDFFLPEEWVTEWLSRESVVIERQVKGEIRELDIRPFVKTMKVEQGKLHLEVQRVEDRMAKVNEVLESLLGGHGVDYRRFLTQRSGQYIEKDGMILSPFQVI